MIFSNDETEFLTTVLKWYISRNVDDVRIVFRANGTLTRLVHGGLHVRDLEIIHMALTIAANENRDAERCLPLIVRVSQMIKTAPPFPQPINSAP